MVVKNESIGPNSKQPVPTPPPAPSYRAPFQRQHLTWPMSPAAFGPPAAVTGQEGDQVAEGYEWWGQHWPLVVHHDEVVTLELPHQVGHGLHVHIDVAEGANAHAESHDAS